MENGNISSFKGKTLDEIDIDLEEDLLNDEGDNFDEKEFLNEEYINTEHKLEQPGVANVAVERKSKSEPKVRRNLVKWTEEQKKLARKFFVEKIRLKQPPKKGECENLISKFPNVFSNKDWKKIKVFIQNEYTKNK